MKRSLLLLAAALVALLALAASGRQETGRLLLVVGAPSAAAALFKDPAWRGVALIEAGRPLEAVAELRRTRSPEAAYNLGNALALSGDLPLAAKAYDLALLRDPDDGDARTNKALVEAALRSGGGAGAPQKGGLANSGAAMEHDPGRDDALEAEDTGSQAAFGDGMIGNREPAAPPTPAVRRRWATRPRTAGRQRGWRRHGDGVGRCGRGRDRTRRRRDAGGARGCRDRHKARGGRGRDTSGDAAMARRHSRRSSPVSQAADSGGAGSAGHRGRRRAAGGRGMVRFVLCLILLAIGVPAGQAEVPPPMRLWVEVDHTARSIRRRWCCCA